MTAAELASALGKLGRGVPKTMSPAALQQRRNAAQARKTVKEADNARKLFRQRKLSSTNGSGYKESETVNSPDKAVSFPTPQ